MYYIHMCRTIEEIMDWNYIQHRKQRNAANNNQREHFRVPRRCGVLP